jgi:hypothetical protein
MIKTFTCHELGGICDKKISGSTFMEIVQKGMEHMQSDDAHKKHMMNLSSATGETQEQWFERMQKEFDARPEDQE